KNNEKEIEDRFYTDLSFGTGGMRGIRGIGSNRINKYTIRKATQGLSDYINSVIKSGNKSVAIAYDCRIGSEEFAVNAALVLAGNGIKAFLFENLHSTPELSFAVRNLKTTAGIVITASHNPQEYNGYKVYWNDGCQIIEPQAKKIVKAVEKIKDFDMINILDNLKEAKEQKLFEYINHKIDDEFIAAVKEQAINISIPGKKNFKIVYSPLHGTGGRPVLQMFREMGFESIYSVEEQIEPNGMFPTCSYANPEDPDVFKLGIELAEKVKATICMANDPDADRIGIAVKCKDGIWRYPNGNQVGLLVMNYLLENRKNIPANGAVISTIVSTPMLDAIAKDKGVKIFRTLTGFKYIGEKIREFEIGKIDSSYIFGFEESYGYLIGTHVRDKDAIVSTMIIAEMAAKYAAEGTDIWTKLDELYNKYGWYQEGITAESKTGIEGMKEIKKVMTALKDMKDEKTLLGQKILYFRDYENKIEINNNTNEKKILDLPSSDVVQFVLEDLTHITARPSGTEPKIKYYFCVVDQDESNAKNKLLKVKNEFEKYIKNIETK
ncbi:MAG: phospho-sugar mutase, partial [Fusobacteriaceae bacterium]